MKRPLRTMSTLILAITLLAVASTANADWLAVGVICQLPQDAAKANEELGEQVDVVKALPFITERRCAIPEKKPKIVWVQRGFKKKGWLADTVDRSIVQVKMVIEGKRSLVYGWTACKWIINTETGKSLCDHDGPLFKAWGE
ncbi:MAG: hypothetical protein KQH53_18785 [Desulfarculaceae bacterium]|nr:hypothetical protein [Desulfarculaceae bacterium]